MLLCCCVCSLVCGWARFDVCRLDDLFEKRLDAINGYDPRNLPPHINKATIMALRKKPEGQGLWPKLEALMATPTPPGVTDEQLVQLASILGITLQQNHLNGSLVSAYVLES